MGKRMFDQGERAWPEEAPFHTPVYVLTHEKREPWVRPGGTTFYFINDGPERALEVARESAGTRDIRIAGGAEGIQQYLNLGVFDELEIALPPVVFGGRRRTAPAGGGPWALRRGGPGWGLAGECPPRVGPDEQVGCTAGGRPGERRSTSRPGRRLHSDVRGEARRPRHA